MRVITAQPYYPGWRVLPGYRTWSRSEREPSLRIDRKLHYVPKQPSLVRRLLSEISFGVRAIASRWGRPDVVVLVSPSLFACALIAPVARLRGLPTVLWVQDLYTRGLEETGQSTGVASKIMRVVESAVLRTVDKVVVIHESFARFVTDDLDVPSERVTIIRNWSHIDISVTPADRETTRSNMGWGPEDVVVLHAGNMGIKQGLSNVVAAARAADDRGSHVHFVLLGGGSQLLELQRRAAGVSRIQFISSLSDDEFGAVLQAADVLLVNELRGVSGMSVPSKLTSYFATGLPVLAAVEPGSVTEAEIQSSGGGVVVPSGDPLALLDAAELLGVDQHTSNRLGSAGQKFRDEHLTQRAGIERFQSAIETLIEEGPAV
ncbi:glycosyltransferase involved in cell wall biosynthesis [Curtobacterium herbarum]|nr:glycosyltransferase involved in cell wall biosynthesis [Curtobacterium herbarum]